MKKIATYFSLTIITIACATLLSSCNSTNSEPDPVPDPVPTIQKIDVKYGIPALYTLHVLADVSVTYIDAAGKSITENLTSTPWEKEVKGITAPFTAKLTLTVKRKTGVKYDKKYYKIGAGHLISFKKGSDGKYSKSSKQTYSLPYPANEVEAHLIKLEATPAVKTIEIPALK